MMQVKTCVESLVNAGTCCWDGCPNKATIATIDEDFIEHARCGFHLHDAVATKILEFSPVWKSKEE